jgi:CDP-diacylglycerol---glycerol-3-phosphate 3-phosphatidyltransferase
MKINLPNQLTLLRLFLIPIFLALVVHDNIYTRLAALLVFIGASLTDLYDGRLARARGLVTVIGTFLDPLADKLLISAAFIVFVQVKEFYVPAWMVVMIIGREFLITGLRTLAISQGRVLPAQIAGKFKTTSQMVAIITTLVIMLVHSLLARYQIEHIQFMTHHYKLWTNIHWILTWVPYWLTLSVTVLTIVSGYFYVHMNIDLLHEKEPATR